MDAYIEKMNQLEKRVIDLTYAHGLTHLSSCLNCVNLIDEIYAEKDELDPFVMGIGHASLALYAVLEKWGWCDAEFMVRTHGTHASRHLSKGIWVSCGSLGQSETVAVGLALADPERTVWLVTSDGSAMEGATWEALRVASQNTKNLYISIVFNGYGAYGKIEERYLPIHSGGIYRVDQSRYPEWLRGLDGHYLKLTKEQYEELMA